MDSDMKKSKIKYITGNKFSTQDTWTITFQFNILLSSLKSLSSFQLFVTLVQNTCGLRKWLGWSIIKLNWFYLRI